MNLGFAGWPWEHNGPGLQLFAWKNMRGKMGLGVGVKTTSSPEALGFYTLESKSVQRREAGGKVPQLSSL